MLKKVLRYKHVIGVGASLILGIIFTMAGFGKLLSPAETAGHFFDPFSPYPGIFTIDVVRLILYWLPRVEIIVGLLLIAGVASKITAAFSTVLIAGFVYSNSYLLTHGLGLQPCGCMGFDEYLLQAELTVRTSLYIDIGMMVLVVLILLYYPGGFARFSPWYVKKRRVGSEADEEGS